MTGRHLEKEAGGRIGLELRIEFWVGDRGVEATSRDEVIAASRGEEVDEKEERSGSHAWLCIRTTWGNLKKPENLGHTTELYNQDLGGWDPGISVFLRTLQMLKWQSRWTNRKSRWCLQKEEQEKPH